MFPQLQDFTWSGVTVGNVFQRPKASVLFVFDGDLEVSGLNAQASVTYQVCTSTGVYLSMYVRTSTYLCMYIPLCIRAYVPVYVHCIFVFVYIPVYILCT